MAESKKKTYNLQYHEVILLKKLSEMKKSTVLALDKILGIDQAAVVRAAMTLAKLGLMKIDEADKMVVALTREGKSAIDKGLPEKQLIHAVIKDKKSLLSKIDIKDKNIALGWAKKDGLVELEKSGNDMAVKVTSKGQGFYKIKSDIELALLNIVDNKPVDKKMIDNLKKRRFITADFRTVRTLSMTSDGEKIARSVKLVKEVSKLTPDLLKDEKWKDVKFRKYNVVAPVSPSYPGKKHFVSQSLEYVRRIWLEMGFKEMEGNLISTSFWNFDALFVPQDHPAREMQDTFYVDVKEGKLPDKKIVKDIKKVHESGDKDSCGWGYDWKESEAKTVVLRTHTTVLSAQTIANIKESDLPVKYFAIGKCFRNESLDWKHLFEFYQMEGIVVDKNANFKQLLGYLKEFYRKMGYTAVRIRPAYFPYTEMSCEVEVFHPRKKEWVELGGAGIFRPEVVKPLLGLDVPILAWGQGLERILSEYYKITDIRDLYKNDVSKLRSTKLWMW
ncbi:MAG: phenylalanine--tRNA ligase subunit alpha [Nanohaloarchaea archaeon]|nr:phenylalanine--tRNA ligase subunit alpha [Candidatus Nanohaloarchaea archaeon]